MFNHVWLILFLGVVTESRVHRLSFVEDKRSFIEISAFGYLKKGFLAVQIHNFSLSSTNDSPVGFSLNKGDALVEYVENHQRCALSEPGIRKKYNLVLFNFDLKSKRLKIDRFGKDIQKLNICASSSSPNTPLPALVDQCQQRISHARARIRKPMGHPPTPPAAKGNRRTKRGLVHRNAEDDEVDERNSIYEQEAKDYPESDTDTYDGNSAMHSKKDTDAKYAANKPVDAKELSRVFSPPKGAAKPTPRPGVTPKTKAQKSKTLTKSQKQPAAPTRNASATATSRSTSTTTTPLRATTTTAMKNLNVHLVRKSVALTESAPGSEIYSTSFVVEFDEPSELGYYYFMFHDCYNYKEYKYDKMRSVTLNIEVVENNDGSYLSAGDVHLPSLFFALALLFLCTSFVWTIALQKKRNDVFKIHYLMAVLVYLKSFALASHGMDLYFIGKYGHQQEVWAVVYYIMHLLKGALLFGTVILIGTGWTFFKGFLTDRDKKIFMIVIPLQVLDNIALIIIEEGESAEQYFKFWRQLFIFVDLLCCAAIILPVVWSIRHLHEASRTDGKAAFNLSKLKLFRQFYIIVICYIYLTRILKYLVAFTVPFNHTWMVDFVEQVGTWVFFVLTGYRFRPVVNNPYLKLSQSDDEEEELDNIRETQSQSGALDNVVRVKRVGGSSKASFDPNSQPAPEGGTGANGKLSLAALLKNIDEESSDTE